MAMEREQRRRQLERCLETNAGKEQILEVYRRECLPPRGDEPICSSFSDMISAILETEFHDSTEDAHPHARYKHPHRRLAILRKLIAFIRCFAFA